MAIGRRPDGSVDVANSLRTQGVRQGLPPSSEHSLTSRSVSGYLDLHQQEMNDRIDRVRQMPSRRAPISSAPVQEEEEEPQP